MKTIILTFFTFIFSIMTAHADVLSDIKERGFIKVGISLGGMPMGGRDARNEAIGYDVDVANMLAEKLGVELRITDVYGDARVSMLGSGQLDLVIGNMTITEERAKVVDFSRPYYRTGLKIAVQRGSGIKSLDDLKGKKVVVGR
ncbi:transporter substrate-binding domain-containing protein [Pseudemcibacter aquimaris]|uniref:transporter substrate-binding domain-containing protein n=1 Tax=Pseudemcibacter aquimaris TaxID=2857064 RepID=UPI003B838C9C|nr:transporter substrate-binding domain-containing protein [Pseudemcibacter aquimaris]